MPTETTNYDLLKPLVNNATDQDLWGGYLNDDMDSIDTLLRVGITFESQASQTSGFTADASISVKKLYPCDATSSGFTATIPAAATAGLGAMVAIKKTDAVTANAITLARSSTDTLDNATSLTITVENGCYVLVSDGSSKWHSIAKPSAAVPNASTTERGIIEIATDAEALGGTDTDRAVTSSGLASSKSLGNSGYYKLPGGLIIQWGRYGSSVGAFATPTITFPLAFPNNCYVVIPQKVQNSAVNDGVFINAAPTTTSFVARAGGAGATDIYYIAIGN